MSDPETQGWCPPRPGPLQQPGCMRALGQGRTGLAGSLSVLNFLSLSLWLWPELLIWVYGANSGLREE